jgi:hypothetical protein
VDLHRFGVLKVKQSTFRQLVLQFLNALLAERNFACVCFIVSGNWCTWRSPKNIRSPVRWKNECSSPSTHPQRRGRRLVFSFLLLASIRSRRLLSSFPFHPLLPDCDTLIVPVIHVASRPTDQREIMLDQRIWCAPSAKKDHSVEYNEFDLQRGCAGEHVVGRPSCTLRGTDDRL